MLVVTPAPFATESLIGYVIRLAEVNGYATAGTLLCYAGYGTAQGLRTHCDVAPLARIVGHKVECLSKIAYSNSQDKETRCVRIRGHKVSSWRSARVLSPKKTSICPLCIEEREFLDSFWDLTLATVCPKHGCKAISACPECGSELSWLRPGLLKCKCGAVLDGSSVESASVEEIELLGLLQAKLEGSTLAGRPNTSRFALAALDEMSFVQFSTLIFVLGQQVQKLRHTEALQRPGMVVRAAASALCDWPRGFRECLRELGKRENGIECPLRGLREHYGDFYRSITGEKSLAAGSTFLRNEFEAFLEKEQSGAVLVARKLHPRSKVRLRRSMTVDWICSRYDFLRKRLEGWCKAKRIDNTAISPKDLRRFVVGAEIINYLKIAKARQISERQAAAMAGIPVTVLKGLSQLGYLGSRGVENLRQGYRASDIDDLTEKLQGVGKRVNAKSIRAKDHVSLARLLETATFWSQLGKSEFMVDVLEGEIEPVGRTGETMQQLFFDQDAFAKYIAEKQCALTTHGVTRTEAGKTLGCSSDCVKELIECGQLSVTPGPFYRNVCKESVLAFRKRYIALNELKKRFGISVRVLMRKAENQGHRLLTIESKRGVTTPFIERSTAAELQRVIEEQRSDAVHRSVAWRERVSSIDKLLQYLHALQRSGRPLPRTGRKLNRKRIAEASGIGRDLFYRSQEARDRLAAFDREDALAHQVDVRTDLEILGAYLSDLRNSDLPIPIGRRGRPNKLEIARAAGVDRDIFYKSPDASDLVARYQENLASSGPAANGDCSELPARNDSETGRTET